MPIVKIVLKIGLFHYSNEIPGESVSGKLWNEMIIIVHDMQPG